MMRRLMMLALALPLAGCCCSRPCCPPPCAEAAAPQVEAPVAAAELKPPTAETWTPVKERAPSKNARVVLAKKRIKGLVWKDTTLDQAMAYLQTITGVPFSLSEKARAEKFDEVRLNAELDDVPVLTLLDVVMTAPWELTYRIEDGAVRILSESEVDRSMRLRYYDVKDLVRNEAGDGIDEVKAAELDVRLRKAVSAAIWKREGVTMEMRNGILIVRAPPKALRQIDEALDRMRRIERGK